MSNLDNLPVECFYDNLELAHILTVKEVAMIWKLTEATVRYHIQAGNVVARKTVTGGNYLVSRTSCLQKWGVPQRDFVVECWTGCS